VSSGMESLFEQAIEQHRAGDLASAEPSYRQILDAHPEHPEALYLLGTLLLQAGRFAESIELLERLTKSQPDSPDTWNNLGVAFKAAGQWEQATRAFEAAVRAQPEYTQALVNLGMLMAERRLFADAEKCYRRVMELTPDDVETRQRLAFVLNSQDEAEEAEAIYRDLLAANPADVEWQTGLGYALTRQERLDEAATLYEEILRAQPEFVELHNNLSYISERRGRLEEAVASAERALELRPEYADGYNNLGTAFRSQHRLDDACEAYQKALGLQPEFPLAEFNLGTTHLLAGRYGEGWAGYERRAETLPTPPRRFDKPRWGGEPLPGRTLFVVADQGFGDTFQFARFLSEVKARSQARVILECQSDVKSLLQGMTDVDVVVSDEEPTPEFDCWISLTNLPGLFDVELDTLPADVPYLVSEAEPNSATAAFVNRVPPDHLKVGLVWQGNPRQARDAMRSCSPKHFGAMAGVERVMFFSLQKGAASETGLTELQEGIPIVDLSPMLHDFSETATAMTELDLIITVDTATAHLAGALGRPVWALLCHTPDWRWHLDRDDSPWYPTMRLFRQPSWGDWGSVISEVTNALREQSQD
jgi:Flp pilus assembly protein TadD